MSPINWAQLKAILWLRWRLSHNQFLRAGRFSAVLSVLILVLLGSASVGFGVFGTVAGFFAGRTAKPETLLLMCDGGMLVFLFVWLIGIMSELQRTESIDLGKLLHLPLTLKHVFLFNFAASHITPTLLLFCPLIFGFCLGASITGGARMLPLVAVCAAVLLMITSWTYCLRGWLSALMSNKRRRGAIAVWITIGFVAIAQAPNLFMRSGLFGNRSTARQAQSLKNEQARERFIQGHMFVPPGWVGYSAWSLKQGEYWSALAATLLASLAAVGGVARSYTLTLRYYRDAYSSHSRKEKVREAAPAAMRTGKKSFIEWSVPLLRDDTAGLALATFRSLMRAPEFRLALFVPLVVVLLVFGSMLGKLRAPVNPVFVPFALTAGVVLIPFTLATLMGNIFGLDRGGFRALVLSPMPRAQMLLARNAAMLPFILGGAVLIMALAAVFFHAGISVLITGVLQAVAGFALFSLLCNYLAIIAPYRYSMNSLQAKKFKPVTLLATLIAMFVWPFIVLLLAIPPGAQYLATSLGMPGWVPLNVISGVPLCALAGWLYFLMLPVQGTLLRQRELKILQEVTAEME